VLSPRFSLAHLTVLGCSPPEITRIAARTGYDFVSFRGAALGLPAEPVYALGSDKKLLRETRDALADTGVRMLDMELAMLCRNIEPASYLPVMEATAELGGRHFIASAWTSDRVLVTERFAELCDRAAPFGLTMDFELVSIASVSTLGEAVAIVRRANRPNAGLLIDTIHFAWSEGALEALDQVPREWFHFAHVCDGPPKRPSTLPEMIEVVREARSALGEGGIDVAAILRHLPDIPYSLEVPNTRLTREVGPEEVARRCIDTARRYLKEASVQSASPSCTV
jgi:sugar phosphate isomerase/epimerase